MASTLFRSLLQSFSQIGIAESMLLSKIHIVEPAVAPSKGSVSGPSRKPICIVGAFLGMVCGLALAFTVHYFDDRIIAPEDVTALGATFLAAMPSFPAGQALLIANKEPASRLHENYRTVRNRIRLAGSDRPLKSLLITSALAGEGKTTIAANLAVSTAQPRRSVVLLDTDLRHPSLHRTFGIENDVGIVSVLTGRAKVDDALQTTEVEGLCVIPSGPVPPNPGDLLESTEMADLIRELSSRFDLVLLDSPPVLVADDAVILAQYADGTVSVVEYGRETRSVFEREQTLLARAGVTPIGSIINKYRPQGWGLGHDC